MMIRPLCLRSFEGQTKELLGWKAECINANRYGKHKRNGEKEF